MSLSYWADKIIIVSITSINVINLAVSKKASNQLTPYWLFQLANRRWRATIVSDDSVTIFLLLRHHGDVISFWDPFHLHGAERLACDVILCAISILSPISSSRQQLCGFLRSRLTASGKYQKGSLLPCCTRLDFSRPCNFYLASCFDQSLYILDN